MSEDELAALVAQWLGYAREDLEAAERVVESSYPPRHACWAAQQAAEKVIKALLIHRRLNFPKTHGLRELNELLPAADRLMDYDEALDALAEWAVEARYPGPWPAATPDDAKQAVASARRIFDLVIARLS